MKFNNIYIDKIMFNGLPVTSVMFNSVDAQKAKIFGTTWDKSSTSTLTRTHDAVGMVANAGIDGATVVNNFDADDTIFNRIIDGVEDSYGNVFVAFPECYIYKQVTETERILRVSAKPITGAYLPWCFYNFSNSKILPYLRIGKYKGSLSDDALRLESKPDKYPLVGRNIVEFRGLAQANGAGYQQLDIHAVDLLQSLFYVEFATLDSQSTMQGYTAGQYTATQLATVSETNVNRIIVANATAALYRVGQAISVGTSQGGNQIFYGRSITSIENYDADNKAIVFDGNPVNITAGNMLYNTGWKNGFSTNIVASSGSLTANDGKYPCVYRGVEEPWGGNWQLVDGINITGRQSWVCKNAEQYISNVFASPYEQLSYVNANANNYVIAMGHDANLPFAEIPTTVGAVESSGYKDYHYQDVGQRIARFGGYWDGGGSAGLSYWYLYSSSSSSSVLIGGRLLQKPL